MPGRSFTTAWHNSLSRFGPRLWSSYALHVERGYEQEYHFRQGVLEDHYRHHGADFYMPLVCRVWMRIIESHGITFPYYMPYVVLPPYNGTQMVDIFMAIDASRRQRREAREMFDAGMRMIFSPKAIESLKQLEKPKSPEEKP